MTAPVARHLRGGLPAIVAAGSAIVINTQAPLISPLLIALAIGAIIANTPLVHRPAVTGHAPATKTLLRCGIVLLGLRISGTELVDVGAAGLVVAAATVAVTYGATLAVGRWLRLDNRLVTLIAAGFSICGAAAIAAVNDTVRARERDVGLAVALVTVYGSLMILIVPVLAGGLDLSDHQGAVWVGASIHEVAQVVAAAAILGTSTLAVATTVKLARVLLLAPVHVLAARGHSDGSRAPLVPWFVAGFAIAVALRSTGLLPAQVVDASQTVATVLLAAGMYGLGLGIRARDMWPIPGRALALATASTVVAAATSLALVVLLVS